MFFESDLKVKRSSTDKSKAGLYDAWLAQIGIFFAQFFAADLHVGLSSSGEERAVVLPADAYISSAGAGSVVLTGINTAVTEAFRNVMHSMGTLGALPFPFPEPFVHLLAHQLFTTVDDEMGTVKVDLDLTVTEGLPGEIVPLIHAIFGPQGYFAKVKGYAILSGTEYLTPEGIPKSAKFYVGRDREPTSNAKRLTPEVQLRRFSRSTKLLRLASTVGNKVETFRADGKMVDDCTGLSHLFPPILLERQDYSQVTNRLVKSAHPVEDQLDLSQGNQHVAALAAARFVQWCWACKGEAGLAVRGFMAIEPNAGLSYEVQRCVLACLGGDNKREFPAEFSNAPNISILGKLINAALIIMNPTSLGGLIDRDPSHADKELRLLDNYGTILRDTQAPLSMSESLRAHCCGFIPFSHSKKRHSGFIQCHLAGHLESPGPLMDFDPFSPGFTQYVSVAERGRSNTGPFALGIIPEDGPGVFENIAQVARSESTILTKFLSKFTDHMSVAAMISFDYNREPISVKYNILSRQQEGAVNGLDRAFNATYDEYFGAIDLYRFLARLPIEVSGDGTISADLHTLEFLPPFTAEPEDANKVEAIIHNCQTALATYDEFTEVAVAIAAREENAEQPTVQFPEGVLNSYREQLYAHFNIPSGEKTSLQILTKLEGKTMVEAVGQISTAFLPPVLVDGNSEAERQKLIVLGYKPCLTVHEPRFVEVSRANLLGDGEHHETYAGKILETMSDKGGFGIGSALAGLAGKVAGGIFGDDVGNAVGSVAGAAASFLPF